MLTTVANLGRVSLMAVAIGSMAPLPAAAQWGLYPWKNVPRTADGKIDLKAPPRRTPDGKIDLSGFWVPGDSVKHLLNLAADMKEEDIPLQAWARALYQERIDNNGKDHPGARCWPSGIPEKDNIPDGVKVVQTPDLMLFLHDSRTIFRQIFTDGRPLPKDPQPTWMGYSIGQWEGDTFVVTTIGQNGKTWLDMRGSAGHRGASRHRTVHQAQYRAHRPGRHPRRRQGVHEAVDGQARLGSAPGRRAHREHLRGEQQRSAPHGGEVTDRADEARRVALASAVGTTIEWYDFFIYGTAAAVVFAPQFFPHVSRLSGTLAAFATFAVGFIARPLGGIVMGHYGDRLGRKSVLVWCLMLMGVSTVGIGLLPGYATLGVWAPILLVLLRTVQGFALGGEWGGAILMSVEHAPRDRRGFFGSFVALGLPAGIILSNLVFLIASALGTPQQFAAWAWRIPFLASAVLVAIGMFVRLGLAESPVFAELLRAQAVRRLPLLDALRGNWQTVVLAAGSYLSISTLGYIVIVYFVSYATRELGFPLTTTLALLVTAAVAFAVSILYCAVWSDRIGRRQLVLWGSAALIPWSMVFFPLIDTKSVPLAAVALCGMLLIQGAYVGPQAAAFSEYFPASVRYSGASLSLTLGTVLGGAIAPFIATALFSVTGNSRLVTVYAVVVSCISWMCALGLGETYRRDLSLAS